MQIHPIARWSAIVVIVSAMCLSDLSSWSCGANENLTMCRVHTSVIHTILWYRGVNVEGEGEDKQIAANKIYARIATTIYADIDCFVRFRESAEHTQMIGLPLKQ